MQTRPAIPRLVGMERRFAALPRSWFAWVDRADYLITKAIIAYWLAPARQRRDAASASPKSLSRTLMLRPLV
jgi:hypothetical protein